MTFSKLDSGITKSSLWSEALHVRIVFVSFLAEKDDTGFVSGSRSGMIRICNVTPEQFDDAIKVLSSPDSDSRTKDFDGRRVEAVEGGWVVINHEKYRLPEREKKESHAEYMRNWRKNKECENVNSREFTGDHNVSPSVSVPVSSSESVLEKDHKRKPFQKPSVEDIKQYCKERSNNIDAEQFFNFYESKGWVVGKSPMKSWKAAIITWEKNNYNNPVSKQTNLFQKSESQECRRI